MTQKVQRKTILLIDDEQEWLNIMASALAHEPYELVTASSGEIALEKAKKTKPDLILCDVRMPIMNGYDLFEQIRKDPKLKNVPYVFISNFNDYDAIKVSKDLGADDYVIKPFDADEAKNMIGSLLAKFQTK